MQPPDTRGVAVTVVLRVHSTWKNKVERPHVRGSFHHLEVHMLISVILRRENCRH